MALFSILVLLAFIVTRDRTTESRAGPVSRSKKPTLFFKEQKEESIREKEQLTNDQLHEN